MDFLKSHEEVYTFLDNDEAGQKATESVQSSHSNMYNCSKQYTGYKDLNDYLCGKKQIQEKKKSKGLKM
jgi:DNA primase